MLQERIKVVMEYISRSSADKTVVYFRNSYKEEEEVYKNYAGQIVRSDTLLFGHISNLPSARPVTRQE